ncbi:MAG: hypothetical protein QOC81_4172 [Thermoanaerobaculia bacterium]|nr:hypothetical protein [Thermoanaerobaculia bacterium]
MSDSISIQSASHSTGSRSEGTSERVRRGEGGRASRYGQIPHRASSTLRRAQVRTGRRERRGVSHLDRAVEDCAEDFRDLSNARAASHARERLAAAHRSGHVKPNHRLRSEPRKAPTAEEKRGRLPATRATLRAALCLADRLRPMNQGRRPRSSSRSMLSLTLPASAFSFSANRICCARSSGLKSSMVRGGQTFFFSTGASIVSTFAISPS